MLQFLKLYNSHSSPITLRRNRYMFWILILLMYLFGIIIYHSVPVATKLDYKLETLASPNYTIKEDFRREETRDYLINTPGCYIPNYALTFMYPTLYQKRSLRPNIPKCGVRAVYIDIVENNKIIFRIDDSKMRIYSKKPVRCCYKLASESKIPGHEHDQLRYTPCRSFRNGTTVRFYKEVILVNCAFRREIVYKDVYVIFKKEKKINITSETNHKIKQWNVLMIGLDSMSRTKIFDTMPQTTQYLKKHKWLDYKGYQKVENNTIRNLISALSDKKISTIYSKCSTSHLSNCADYFIWKKFRDAGYKTAHGESNLRPSESLFNAFKRSPTDYYMRTFFLTRERSSEGTLCTGKRPSSTHLLEYAHSFVDSYKTNNFFGIFWINSYTYSYHIPPHLDTDMVDFFEKLNKSGLFDNTFVILFSDQGYTHGNLRTAIETYYDSRLPMLFLWIPLKFRNQYADKHYNLRVNQERLMTPYDLYITLADILNLSMNSSEKIHSEACPLCTGLFEIKSPNSTCADAGISEQWCSCHNISRVDIDNKMVDNSVSVAVAYVRKISISIKTIPCTYCQRLRFPTVIRAHEYQQGEKTYHVIAFHMSPNRLKFEAIVVNYGNQSAVLYIGTLTHYNVWGNCVLRNQDRPYCACSVGRYCSKKVTTKKRPDLVSFGGHLDQRYSNITIIYPLTYTEIQNRTRSRP